MNIKLRIDNFAKCIQLEAVTCAKHGDKLYLAEPQHVNYYTEIKFNSKAHNHEIYLTRGLLFEKEVDALLYSKSFISRGDE